MVLNALVFLNASCPMLVIVAGIVIWFKNDVLLKAFVPILVILDEPVVSNAKYMEDIDVAD